MLMELLGFILAILISFYLLAQVTDTYFIPALERISEKNNVPSDVAGTTLMAMGSSAPELFIALVAVFKPGGHVEIGMGTIVGSALFNVLVIVGAAALARRAVLSWQPILRDVSFYLLSIVLLAWVFFNDTITIVEALILMGLYGGYIFVAIKWKKWFPYQDDATEVETPPDVDKVKKIKILRFLLSPFDGLMKLTYPKIKFHWAVFAISIAWISLLSWVLVESAIHVSHALNIPEAIIALTVLAIGTSIPDLISSYLVAKDGKGGMAISNAIGSNIFDMLVGLGLPWLMVMLLYDSPIEVVSENLFVSIILLFSSVVLVFLMLAYRRWIIRKQTGIILIGIYVVYLVWQVMDAIF